MTGWVKIKPAARYAGVSTRTMRTWLRQGLKHSRLPTGTILIHIENIDSFLNGYAVLDNKVDRIVDEIIAGSKKKHESNGYPTKPVSTR